MKQQIIVTTAPHPVGGYSQGMVANGFLFTAGFGPQHPESGMIPDGIEAQTRQVLANVGAVLEAAGLDFSDVVKSTVHLQDVERDFAAFDAVYREVVPEPRPARTTVGSVLAGILVEIDVVAAQPPNGPAA